MCHHVGASKDLKHIYITTPHIVLNLQTKYVRRSYRMALWAPSCVKAIICNPSIGSNYLLLVRDR